MSVPGLASRGELREHKRYGFGLTRAISSLPRHRNLVRPGASLPVARRGQRKKPARATSILGKGCRKCLGEIDAVIRKLTQRIARGAPGLRDTRACDSCRCDDSPIGVDVDNDGADRATITGHQVVGRKVSSPPCSARIGLLPSGSGAGTVASSACGQHAGEHPNKFPHLASVGRLWLRCNSAVPKGPLILCPAAGGNTDALAPALAANVKAAMVVRPAKGSEEKAAFAQLQVFLRVLLAYASVMCIID